MPPVVAVDPVFHVPVDAVAQPLAPEPAARLDDQPGADRGVLPVVRIMADLPDFIVKELGRVVAEFAGDTGRVQPARHQRLFVGAGEQGQEFGRVGGLAGQLLPQRVPAHGALHTVDPGVGGLLVTGHVGVHNVMTEGAAEAVGVGVPPGEDPQEGGGDDKSRNDQVGHGPSPVESVQPRQEKGPQVLPDGAAHSFHRSPPPNQRVETRGRKSPDGPAPLSPPGCGRMVDAYGRVIPATLPPMSAMLS
jgi:hypothetical protein